LGKVKNAKSAGARSLKLQIIGAGKSYSFRYRAPGADWSTLVADADGSILSTQVAGGFVGSYIGLFARTYQIVQTSQSSVSSNSVSTSQSKGSP
jgi:beta-xylosidase